MKIITFAALISAISVNALPMRSHELTHEDTQHDLFYTWKGDKCDGGCQALKGDICGKTFKDCCKGDCEKGTIYDSCDNKGKFDKNKIDCSIPYKKPIIDSIKDKAKNAIFGALF